MARNAKGAPEILRDLLSPLGKVMILTDSVDAFGTTGPFSDSSDSPDPSVLHAPDEKAHGFGGMMSASGSFPWVTAWSRAFAYLGESSDAEEAVWFVEDDPDSFQRLVDVTSSYGPDLAAFDIRCKSDSPRWPWWGSADGYFPDPAAAYQPLCRLSNRLVKAVLAFQKEHGRLIFHEVLFASIARQQEMTSLSWDRSPELCHLLSSFRYRPEVTSCVHGISHPVKDAGIHASICTLPPAEFPRKGFASLSGWSIRHAMDRSIHG